jgi:hypothetical protein
LPILFPAILAEFTVNADHFALNQVLIKGFTLSSPKDDIKEIRLIHPLVSALLAAIYRNGKFTDRLAIGGIF